MRVVQSSLRGGTYPSMRDFDTLRAADLATLAALDHGDRRLVSAGVIMARVRVDDANDVEAALAIATELRLAGPDPRDLTLDLETRLALEAALTEAYLAAGVPVEAVMHAQRLLAHLPTVAADPRWRARALACAAAAYALDGQPDVAEHYLGEVAAVGALEGWDPDETDYMSAVAGLLLAFADIDLPRSSRITAALAILAEREPSARSLLLLARTVEAVNAHRMDDALGLVQRVFQGSIQPSGPSLVRGLAHIMHSMLLIARGSPQQALALLRDTAPSANHLICPGYARASAYLQMREYRCVLTATAPCLRVRAEHSWWTYTSLLLRRAVANLRLGHHRAALDDAVEAMTIAGGIDPVAALFLMPPEDLRALGLLIARRRPRLIPQLRYIQTRMAAVPPTLPPIILLPVLSQRERVVAHLLRGTLSYPQIARELSVSTSTVKSQAIAIFRKLGVASREEAVLTLERGGFYDC